MDTEQERARLTNRNIARILKRLEHLNMPQMAQDDIKRAFWFLSNDINNLLSGNKD